MEKEFPKERQGGTLDDREQDILNQIDDYTYLPRYENQTMLSHLRGAGGTSTLKPDELIVRDSKFLDADGNQFSKLLL